jgi:SecD/SecF fusion protein
MRNKGFFWFLTILLTVVCIYQLSFTWVSNSVEKKADKEAQTRVDEEWKNRDGADSLYLPNNTAVSFDDATAKELAKAAYVNDILTQKAGTPVYPLFGSTFKDVKKRSLALGLDLVGGMSVTLEISIPKLVESYARNKNELDFKKVYAAAKTEFDENGGEFVDIFDAKYTEIKKDDKMVKLFAIADIDDLNIKSTNAEVIAFLKGQESGAMDGVEEIMNRRINQFGVAQPNIQKDPSNNRLYIELPGVMDEETVGDKLKSTANLQFFETYRFSQRFGQQWEAASAISTLPEQEEIIVDTTAIVDTTSVAAIDDPADPDATDTNLVNEELTSDLSGASLVESGEDGVKGLRDLVLVVDESRMFVRNDDRGAVDKLLRRKDIMREFDETCKFMWSATMEKLNDEIGQGYFLYPCLIPESGKALVGGKDIKSASRDYDQQDGQIVVSIRMTTEGADKWAQMTEENVDRIVAITMDGVVFSAPNVITPIKDGNTQISGSFSVQEADDLSGLLNGGALPAPCDIIEQNKVGPTIGAENSRAGLMSFGVALLLVFIYMVFYYGKAGLVADLALFANILFLLGALASFGAVLTLAGIAGIVLTIGMAVDANVLIFERIREEQANGKDLKTAVDTGFKKALSSIIDANVTTMLTAIVLKAFGSGPIESFATTLIIGIFTSVFAALVISRLVITMWLKRGGNVTFETKVTKNAFKSFNFDFVGKRKRFYMISGVLIIGGIAALAFRGLNPSVEFTGGRTFGVEFEKSTDGFQDDIKDVLIADFVDSASGKAASVEAKTKSNSYFLEISTNYRRSDKDANDLVKAELIESLTKVESKVGVASVKESRSVSPTVSEELKSSSILAIGLSLIIIFAYILMRFGRWQYSTGAILAMIHDVTLVLAVFSIFHGILPFNMDIDQAFIAAILTVIGYSINDTVIVFDRIRENLRTFKGQDESATINRALNSTLSRTINTSMTTFIVLLMIFVFGGAAIKGFIFALMIGVIVGTYSSVCIATPILIDFSRKSKTALKDKEKVVVLDDPAVMVD